MNFEELQEAWQSQDTSAKVTIRADALLKEVRRKQRQFRATIFWRDVRELGVACGIGVLYALAMSTDFPNSNRRFARLSG